MYEYLIGSLIFLVVWIILYFIRKDLRKKMVFASLLSTPFAITQIWFKPQYWNPQVLFNIKPDIESFLFCFVVGGIASVLYEYLLKKHLEKIKEKKVEIKKHFIILFVVMFGSGLFFLFTFKMSFMFAVILSLLSAVITIWIIRRDLIKNSIIGGILFLMVYIIMFYILNTFLFYNWTLDAWNQANLIGITFLRIPLEELVYALVFGMLWSPIYEYIKGYRIKD